MKARHRPRTATRRQDEAEDDTVAVAEPEPAFGRVLAFSDGVFAFAITLMVLAIRIPHPTDADAKSGLLSLLTSQWPAYLAFALSFFWVGLGWANHRILFSKLVKTDHFLIWGNLLYLLLVAFLPIPTAVLGQWIGSSPSNQLTAVLFYGAVAVTWGFLFNLLWWHAAYWGKLTSPQLTPEARRAHTIAWMLAPFLGAAVTCLGFIDPRLTFGGFLLVGLAYVMPVPRLLWRRLRNSGT
jgi:uncharacterized membrane protein